MISEILKQHNNTGLHFQWITDTKGCDLNLRLSYEGERVKSGKKEQNEYVLDFFAKRSVLTFGGGDLELWKGVQTTGNYLIGVQGKDKKTTDIGFNVNIIS